MGKSTLINSLLGRKKLVRTGSGPAHSGPEFFSDQPALELRGSAGLRLCRGVQGPRGQLGAVWCWTTWPTASPWPWWCSFRIAGGCRVREELFLWEFLREHGRRVIPVLTKADKLKRGERDRQLKLFTAPSRPSGSTPARHLVFGPPPGGPGPSLGPAAGLPGGGLTVKAGRSRAYNTNESKDYFSVILRVAKNLIFKAAEIRNEAGFRSG